MMTLESSVSDTPNCGVTLKTLEVSFMLLESSIMLLESIYSTGITHDDHHLQSSYFYSTGHSNKKQMILVLVTVVTYNCKMIMALVPGVLAVAGTLRLPIVSGLNHPQEVVQSLHLFSQL